MSTTATAAAAPAFAAEVTIRRSDALPKSATYTVPLPSTPTLRGSLNAAPAAGPEEWYRSLPKITRGYLTACVASTILVQTELVSPMLLYLDFPSVTAKLEVWRLLTNFCFFGGFGMPFVFSMFFLVRYGKELEAKRFEGRSADFLWCMGFAGLIMTLIAYVMGSIPFLAQSMLSTIVYLWSREYAEQTLSIFGLFSVQAAQRSRGARSASSSSAPLQRPSGALISTPTSSPDVSSAACRAPHAERRMPSAHP